MCACCSEDVAEQVEKNDFKSYEDVTSEIMSFDSKDDFKKALDNYDDTKNITRSLTAFSCIVFITIEQPKLIRNIRV